MVQSPWREDDKWENTGLRAGGAETDRKSVRLDVGKPTASRALRLHDTPNPELCDDGYLGKKGQGPSWRQTNTSTPKLLVMPRFALKT